jgi:UDP-N-acetylglucosamine 3-dehydrogenase
MLSVLVVGAGTMGKKHLQAYGKMEYVRIAGVVDVRSSEEIQMKEHPLYRDFDEAIQQAEVDVVDICLPTHMHCMYVKKAASYKKHVICEKPIARNLKEAEEMLQACKENQVELFVGHVVRFFPAYQQAKNLLADGRLGEIEAVKTSRNSKFPNAWNNWYADSSNSGGLILDLLIHDLDYLRWCFGEVEEVVAARIEEDQIRHTANAFITLRFSNYTVAQVGGSWSLQPFAANFEWIGSKGKLSYKHGSSHLQFAGENGVPAAIQVSDGLDPYQLELEHFLQCLEKGIEPVITADDAYQAVRIALAAIESAMRKMPVFLPIKVDGKQTSGLGFV